jgi:hypothetical protein
MLYQEESGNPAFVIPTHPCIVENVLAEIKLLQVSSFIFNKVRFQTSFQSAFKNVHQVLHKFITQ